MTENESKCLVFDMDGTIADLYGVTDWLPKLLAHDETPYIEAKPLYKMVFLNTLLRELQLLGWKIIITSWLANNSTKEYDKKVRKAKIQWLVENDFPLDEIHIVKYGTTKADCTRGKYDYQILIDDNAKVRKGWHLGETVDASQNILPFLQNLAKGVVSDG